MLLGLRKAMRRPRLDTLTARQYAFVDVPSHEGGVTPYNMTHGGAQRCPGKCTKTPANGMECIAGPNGGFCNNPVTVDSIRIGPNYMGAHTSVQTSPQAIHFENLHYSHEMDRSRIRPAYTRIVSGTTVRNGSCGRVMDSGHLDVYLTRDGLRKAKSPASEPLVNEDLPVGSACSLNQRGCSMRAGIRGPAVLCQISKRKQRYLHLQ